MPESPAIPWSRISIVIPAKNEADSLRRLLPAIKSVAGGAQVIVVDDGSEDDTRAVVAGHDEVQLVRHPYSKGNGAAIKSGARAATGDYVVFMDGDGQHDPHSIPDLLAPLAGDFDMVVGARDRKGQANAGRAAANAVYNRFAGWMTGQQVDDLTSGFRAVDREKFLEFIHLLPNGFSYPTTITMAFFRMGYSVTFVPITVVSRKDAKSHLRPFRDGLRFLLIITRVGTMYSPLKLFAPTGFVLMMLGLANYMYWLLTVQRFTNMSALLISSGILVLMIGLVAEQISMLIYKK